MRNGPLTPAYPFHQLACEVLHSVYNVDLHVVHGFRQTLLKLGQVHRIVLKIGLQSKQPRFKEAPTRLKSGENKLQQNKNERVWNPQWLTCICINVLKRRVLIFLEWRKKSFLSKCHSCQNVKKQKQTYMWRNVLDAVIQLWQHWNETFTIYRQDWRVQFLQKQSGE